MGLQGPAGKHGKQSPAHSTWFSSFSQSSCLLGTFSRFPAICYGLFCCLKPSWCSSMFPLAPQGLALHFRGKIEAPRQGFSHSLTPKLLNLHLFFFLLLHSPSTWVMLALPPENGFLSHLPRACFYSSFFSPMHWQALCIRIKQSLNISK